MLPKFQQLLNDRQTRQKYPEMRELHGPIVWKAAENGQSQKNTLTQKE